MKRPEPADDSTRFRGGVRYHRRAGSQPQSSWDQWVAGGNPDRPKRNWLGALGILLGIVALIGIGVALFIEMR